MKPDEAVAALTILLAAICLGVCVFAYALGGPYVLAGIVFFLAVIL